MPNSDTEIAETTRVRHSWPITFKNVKHPPQPLAIALCVVGILVALWLTALTLIAIGRLAFDLFGGDQLRATEAIKSLLPLAAAAIGLPLIIWRLLILDQQTRISEQKTQIDRQTHYTSIFAKSIEQLGQTKEIKENRERNGVLETLSQTLPNIEVRLGGIHSLARLAEESKRDAIKIENTLLSYVR